MNDLHDRHRKSKSRSVTSSRKSSKSPSRDKSRIRSKTCPRSLSWAPNRNGGKYTGRSRHNKSRSRARSRSRSRSYSGDRRRSNRSHSRFASLRRSIHDNNVNNKCLGLFGLNLNTTEDQLYNILEKYGPIDKIKILINAKTKRSRGFGFAYFKYYKDAKVAIEKCSDLVIEGYKVRVDYSMTQRAHSPTPGHYMGKPTIIIDERSSRSRRYNRYDRDRYYNDIYESRFRGRDGGSGGRGGDYYRDRRSPSYYKNRSRYDSSRSSSYSPRRNKT